MIQCLTEDEVVLSMVNFPLLGVAQQFTSPPSKPMGPIAMSQYVSDDCINPHPRRAASAAVLTPTPYAYRPFPRDRTPSLIPLVLAVAW